MLDQYGNIPLGGTSPDETLVESVEMPKNDFFYEYSIIQNLKADPLEQIQ